MAGRHPAHHAWCLVRPARCEGERKGRCPESALQMPTAATLPRRGISKMVSGMTATLQTLLLLLAVLVVVAVAARRLNTAPSILLVVAGIGLALTPGLPQIELAPELVLLGILPPLIYSAGVAMSWREFRFNLRPITLLAFGCVVFTPCAVAAAVHGLLGMPLAVGFVLGAIVAPPDVVAPLGIALRVRRRAVWSSRSKVPIRTSNRLGPPTSVRCSRAGRHRRAQPASPLPSRPTRGRYSERWQVLYAQLGSWIAAHWTAGALESVNVFYGTWTCADLSEFKGQSRSHHATAASS